MVNRGQQEAGGRLRDGTGRTGFCPDGGDPVILAFENPAVELSLELTLGTGQLVHSYEVLTFEERTRRQQKFRY